MSNLENATGRTKVKLKATNAHPYLNEGEIFGIHPVHEAGLREKKWAVDENSTETKVEGAAVPKTLEETLSTEAKSSAPKQVRKK